MKKKLIIFLCVVAGAVIVSCNKSDDANNDAQVNTNDVNAGYTQVERLARPAINEGLVITNDFLNAFNAIPPTADLTPAAAPVLAEATAVLDVVTGLLPGGPTSAQVAGQFLPDVMRIDTVVSNPGVGPSTSDANVGYISCVNATGAGPLLCGGRKLEDDVMDITLNYIASGVPTQPYTISDGITYTTTHNPLLPAFPFLAAPR